MPTSSIPSPCLEDNLTPAQRARVEELKRERAKLVGPIDRIAFDNGAGTDGKEFVLRLIAVMESPVVKSVP